MEFSQQFRPAKMAKSLELASFQAFFKCPKVEVLLLYPQRSYLRFLGCKRSRCLFMSLYLSKISANFQKSCHLILTWTFISNWTKPRHWKTPTKQAFRRSISLAASDLWDVRKKTSLKKEVQNGFYIYVAIFRWGHVWVTQNQMYTHI